MPRESPHKLDFAGNGFRSYNVYARIYLDLANGNCKRSHTEFRENLASYLLEAEQPLAITRSWGFCGYCIPGRRKRT